jgi:Spy/CpxP family protein refolding chaperone
MKKKITKILPMMIFASFFVFVSTVTAFEGPSHEGLDKGAREGRMKQVMDETMQELGLTEEQREQIKEQKKVQREKGDKIRTEMEQRRTELKNELNKYDGDQGKVNKLVDQITDLKKAQLQNRVEGIQSIKKVLTEEQFEGLMHKLEIKKEVAKELRKAHGKDKKSRFKKDRRF